MIKMFRYYHELDDNFKKQAKELRPNDYEHWMYKLDGDKILLCMLIKIERGNI